MRKPVTPKNTVKVQLLGVFIRCFNTKTMKQFDCENEDLNEIENRCEEQCEACKWLESLN